MQALVLNGAASVKLRQPEEPGTRNDPRRKIDVVTIGDEWGSKHGGMSTMNREIAINMASQPNVRVTFLIVGGSCNIEEKKEAGSKGVELLVAENNSEEYCKMILNFYPERDLGSLIVVGHGKFGKDAQNIRNKCDCKLMHVLHTPSLSLGMQKTDDLAIRKGEEKDAAELDMCKAADLVMAIGPLLRNEGTRSLSWTGKMVIEFTPGILEEFKDIERSATELDDFKVILVGRDDVNDFEAKGYDIAAKAFADGELKNKPYKLLFVGASEKSQGGKKIKESFRDWGMSDVQLEVKRFASRKELKEEFRIADLAIMPSRVEGFGLVGLEALSAGLPLLVSSQTGFAKALEKVEFGDLVIVRKFEDPAEWAKRIADVQRKNKDMRLREMQYLRKEYEKMYSWNRECQKVAKKMASVIFGKSFLNFPFMCAWR